MIQGILKAQETKAPEGKAEPLKAEALPAVQDKETVGK